MRCDDLPGRGGQDLCRSCRLDEQLCLSASQKKVVHCYRLCTKGTVEERILAAAQQKTIMNALVMHDGGANQVVAGLRGGVDTV